MRRPRSSRRSPSGPTICRPASTSSSSFAACAAPPTPRPRREPRWRARPTPPPCTRRSAAPAGAGRPAGASAAYREAARRRPGDARVLVALGRSLRRRRHYGEAAHALREALRVAPDDARAWYHLGVALERQGRHDEGLVALREALQRRPTFVAAHVALAGGLRRRGRWTEEAEVYEAALRLRPDDADLHAGRGLALGALRPRRDVRGAGTARGRRARVSRGDPPEAGFADGPRRVARRAAGRRALRGGGDGGARRARAQCRGGACPLRSLAGAGGPARLGRARGGRRRVPRQASGASRRAGAARPGARRAGARQRAAGATLAAGTLRSRPNSSSSRRGVPGRCRRDSRRAPGLSSIARVVFWKTRTSRKASCSALAAAIEPASTLAADSTGLSSLTKAPTVGAMRFLPSGVGVTVQSIVTTAWPRMFGRTACWNSPFAYMTRTPGAPST